MKSVVTATIRLDLQTLLNMVEQREKSDADDDGAAFLHGLSTALHGLADKYGEEAIRKDRVREGRL